MTETCRESSRATRIHAALTAAFAPEALDVVDESAGHSGHVGARPEGETHFAVTVISSQFAGKNRVARHRAVQAALAAEFAQGLHALSIIAKAPGE